MKLVPLLFCLAGCASTSDVVSTGTDTYMVSAHGVMGYSSEGEQKAKAYTRANEFCAAKGKKAEQTATSGNAGGFGRVAAGEVHFRCN